MNRLEHAVSHCEKLRIKRDNTPGRSAHLYLIGVHDYVKVGIANSVRLRLTELQVGCPYELSVLASFPTNNAQRDERRLHRRWTAYATRGEWFRVPYAELALVCSALSIEDVLSV